jgi:hypothetical protein
MEGRAASGVVDGGRVDVVRAGVEEAGWGLRGADAEAADGGVGGVPRRAHGPPSGPGREPPAPPVRPAVNLKEAWTSPGRWLFRLRRRPW